MQKGASFKLEALKAELEKKMEALSGVLLGQVPGGLLIASSSSRSLLASSVRVGRHGDSAEQVGRFRAGCHDLLAGHQVGARWSRIGRCQRARRASRRPIGKAYGGNAIDRSLPSGDSTEPRWGDARRTTGRFAPTRRCSQNGGRSHHPCRATGHIPWYAGGAHCEHRGSAKKDQRAYENHP